MGHKVSPLLLRLGYIQDWRSKWFAKKSDYAKFVHMDIQIRKFIKDNYKQAAIAKIIIERLTDKMKIKIHCARPGLIIGRHGQDIERLRGELAAIAKQELSIEPIEVKQPAADAQLIAQNVAVQLEKRIAFRRAIKRSIEQATASGVKGIKISVAGRLGGAEMSRRETYKQGKLPLSTLRADIDYGFAEALTTYGLIGVKAWTYKGEILLKSKQQPAIVGER
ncbi:MAG: 30S ribosomal protein S3 [Omnitrophica WOR_2 bacterium GWF2_43_52]|nr:MAG: 30S ribosomal protein S3 [Omnitrophica WOR_2 bacterium GWA2_44_7]OGX17198.1 MAG: 30S ribosomal protein S3 [Omnitrophica WOR_2 bacterium GWC2_44_8]OGX20315.1 MAG: 30S ribosomal protein S3 [Omnitrophica WOR_2 bacterium GWF2_43_52]OGX53714.1 MAG: 30S ribosomal protein S3 [Omnitrophica WOR_2 bacterium RIFOXYC2_FULL_43_9]HAH21252.1 30S ribosomal protein S3 [Candidatus Omnitrophota bacterium]